MWMTRTRSSKTRHSSQIMRLSAAAVCWSLLTHKSMRTARLSPATTRTRAEPYTSSTLLANRTTFTHNTAVRRFRGPPHLAIKARLLDVAQSLGGAIEVSDAHAELRNASFVRNVAILGGYLSLQRNICPETHAGGGAAYITSNSTVNATFAAFTDNTVVNSSYGGSYGAVAVIVSSVVNGSYSTFDGTTLPARLLLTP